MIRLLWLRRSRFPCFWSPMPRSERDSEDSPEAPCRSQQSLQAEIGTPSGRGTAVSEIGPH